MDPTRGKEVLGLLSQLKLGKRHKKVFLRDFNALRLKVLPFASTHCTELSPMATHKY